MTAYSQGDPRQKIQICDSCNCPTGNCEEDSLYICIEETGQSNGPFCSECYESLQAGPNQKGGKATPPMTTKPKAKQRKAKETKARPIEVVIGRAEAGFYLAINGNRVSGMKPFGEVVHNFKVEPDRFFDAVREVKARTKAK